MQKLERMGLHSWELYYVNKENGSQSIGAGVYHPQSNKVPLVQPYRRPTNLPHLPDLWGAGECCHVNSCICLIRGLL
jgi:hypothetical protein